MDPIVKQHLVLEMLRHVYNFGSSVPGTEELALADLRMTIAKTEHKLHKPRITDPGHNPFDRDDDSSL